MNSTSLLAEISIGNALIALVVLFVLIGVAAPKKGEKDGAFFGFCLLLFICTLLFTVVYFPYKWIFKRDRTTVVEKTAPPKTSPTDGNVPDNTPAVSEPKRNPPATKSVVIGEGGLPIGEPERQPPPPAPAETTSKLDQEIAEFEALGRPSLSLSFNTIDAYSKKTDQYVKAAGKFTTADATGLALYMASTRYMELVTWLYENYDGRDGLSLRGLTFGKGRDDNLNQARAMMFVYLSQAEASMRWQRRNCKRTTRFCERCAKAGGGLKLSAQGERLMRSCWSGVFQPPVCRRSTMKRSA